MTAWAITLWIFGALAAYLFVGFIISVLCIALYQRGSESLFTLDPKEVGACAFVFLCWPLALLIVGVIAFIVGCRLGATAVARWLNRAAEAEWRLGGNPKYRGDE